MRKERSATIANERLWQIFNESHDRGRVTPDIAHGLIQDAVRDVEVEGQLTDQTAIGLLIAHMPPVVWLEHEDQRLRQETYTGLKKKTLHNLCQQGRGPRRVRIGKNVAFWSIELASWIVKRAKRLL